MEDQQGKSESTFQVVLAKSQKKKLKKIRKFRLLLVFRPVLGQELNSQLIMRIIYWNVRRFGNPKSRRMVIKLCSDYKPEFMFLPEHFIEANQVSDQFWSSLSLKIFVVNNRNTLSPNLWGVWHSRLDPLLISVSDQQIAFLVVLDNCRIFVSDVYACTTYILRRQLWLELSNLLQNNVGPWLFVGDFDAIIGAHEMRGRGLPSKLSCEEFVAWTDACKLTHLETQGVQFTWSNRRRSTVLIEKRLDRGICNDAWLDSWSTSSCCTLARNQSDHFPLLLDFKKDSSVIHSSFKFQNMWKDHEDFWRLVKEVWVKPIAGCPM